MSSCTKPRLSMIQLVKLPRCHRKLQMCRECKNSRLCPQCQCQCEDCLTETFLTMCPHCWTSIGEYPEKCVHCHCQCEECYDWYLNDPFYHAIYLEIFCKEDGDDDEDSDNESDYYEEDEDREIYKEPPVPRGTRRFWSDDEEDFRMPRTLLSDEGRTHLKSLLSDPILRETVEEMLRKDLDYRRELGLEDI